jgi:uncharacterized protein YraI
MQNTRLDRRSSSSNGGGLLEGPAAWLITFLVIPGLIAAVLLLPPISLLDRLQSFTYTRIGASGGAITDPDGTVVNFAAEGVISSFQADIKSNPRTDFIEGRAGNDLYEAAQQLPETVVAKSPVYQIDVRGRAPAQSVVTLPIPNDSLPYETLGIYEWTGSSWRHMPSVVLVAEDKIEARLDYVPNTFMVVQTAPTVPEITMDLGTAGTLPSGATVTAEAKAGLMLRGDGGLEGVAPENAGKTVPVLRNWDGQVVRTDLINNLLVDPGLQDNQINAIDQLVVEKGYPGVVIDYRGVDAVPTARADFARFIGQLAERLHANNRTLSVRVEMPQQISAEEWNTLGYDWRALGQAVDKLIIPAPVDPRAYAAGAEMEQLLAFATSEVDRAKVEVELTGQSVERSGPYLLLKGYQEALTPLIAQVSAEAVDGQIQLSLSNPKLAGAVQWDDALGMYVYTYTDDQGQQRTVFVENAASLGRKLEMLRKYNVTKANLLMPANGDIDPGVPEVLKQFQLNQPTALEPQLEQLAVAYTLYGADGAKLDQQVRPLQASDITMAAPAAGADKLTVEAQIVRGNGTAVTTAQSTVIALAGAPAAAAKAADGSATTEAAPASDVTLTTAEIVNVREGPGTNYPVITQMEVNTPYKIVGKTQAGDWWQIAFGDKSYWVISQLVNVQGDGGAVAVISELPAAPVAAVAAPAAAPAEAQSAEAAPAEASAPAAAPAASAAAPVSAPSGGGSFGYGVQGHVVDNGQMFQVLDSMAGMGFNWFKQQIEWKRFESAGPGQIDWGAMDEIVNASGSRGVSVLFSIVKAPAWAREPGFDGSVEGPPLDPQTFANFVGAVAGKYCGTSLKAIEVWNEQNLHYEWGNKPLDPNAYVQMLALSYNSIKAACPSMQVISGALTPAGNNAPYAMDDFTYLEAMFAAGANNYLDGVGAHPSGYNVPPSATWENGCEAIQKTGNSFNGACDSPHHSWSFQSTMLGYRNIANVYGGNNKLIWPTEFGWAAGGAQNPNYRYADDNDYTEQAQWTVEAYTMMRNWGWVGPAFLWNLNFRVVANGTELAQWGIVDPAWNPLPVYTALAQMPK